MGSSAELRKIQVTGGSTYIVSLPKNWAREAGIKPGSRVALFPQSDMSLLVVPREDLWVEEHREATLEIPPEKDPEEVIRNFIAHYLAGYDTIRLRFERTPDANRSYIKETLRSKMIGVEIIEETSDEIVAQCLIGYTELPVKRALRRMNIIASSMHRDAIASLTRGNRPLAEEVIGRDDEIDRFYFLVVRQLKMAVQNRSIIEEIGLTGPVDCLGYRLVAKSVERAADHTARIAHVASVLKTPLPETLLEEVKNMSLVSNEVYDEALDALQSLDLELAHASIERTRDVRKLEVEAMEQLLNSKLDVETVLNLRLVLESIRRIAEYGADIAEVAVNLAFKKPSGTHE
jgi:phosphate uptake regulator